MTVLAVSSVYQFKLIQPFIYSCKLRKLTGFTRLFFHRCIWCVDTVSRDRPTALVKTKYVPGTMSVTSRRLLVTPLLLKGSDNSGFYLYDVNGHQIKVVPWRSEATALHSVETTRGTIIACATWPQSSASDQVSSRGTGVSTACNSRVLVNSIRAVGAHVAQSDC